MSKPAVVAPTSAAPTAQAKAEAAPVWRLFLSNRTGRVYIGTALLSLAFSIRILQDKQEHALEVEALQERLRKAQEAEADAKRQLQSLRGEARRRVPGPERLRRSG